MFFSFFVYIFFFAVRMCNPISVWSGMVTNSTLRVAFISVGYWCEEGFAFPDRLERRQTMCNGDGVWWPPVVQCEQGETLHQIKILLF